WGIGGKGVVRVLDGHRETIHASVQRTLEGGFTSIVPKASVGSVVAVDEQKCCLRLRQGFAMRTRLHGNTVFLLETHYFWNAHANSSTLCSPVMASTWNVSSRPSTIAARIMWMTSI